MHTITLQGADAEATRLSVDIVSQLRPGDLALPTPCAGWDLSDLLSHMIAQHHGFAAAANGVGADLTAWRPVPLPEDPIDVYASSAEALLKAFAPPDVPDRPFTLPEFPGGKPFPGRQAISFHFIDYVVHAWDVARTIGVPYTPRAEILEMALPVAKAVPQGDARLVPGAAFAPALDIPAATDPLTEILLLLGRDPAGPRKPEGQTSGI